MTLLQVHVTTPGTCNYSRYLRYMSLLQVQCHLLPHEGLYVVTTVPASPGNVSNLDITGVLISSTRYFNLYCTLLSRSHPPNCPTPAPMSPTVTGEPPSVPAFPGGQVPHPASFPPSSAPSLTWGVPGEVMHQTASKPIIEWNVSCLTGKGSGSLFKTKSRF